MRLTVAFCGSHSTLSVSDNYLSTNLESWIHVHDISVGRLRGRQRPVAYLRRRLHFQAANLFVISYSYINRSRLFWPTNPAGFDGPSPHWPAAHLLSTSSESPHCSQAIGWIRDTVATPNELPRGKLRGIVLLFWPVIPCLTSPPRTGGYGRIQSGPLDTGLRGMTSSRQAAGNEPPVNSTRERRPSSCYKA